MGSPLRPHVAPAARGKGATACHRHCKRSGPGGLIHVQLTLPPAGAQVLYRGPHAWLRNGSAVYSPVRR